MRLITEANASIIKRSFQRFDHLARSLPEDEDPKIPYTLTFPVNFSLNQCRYVIGLTLGAGEFHESTTARRISAC